MSVYIHGVLVLVYVTAYLPDYFLRPALPDIRRVFVSRYICSAPVGAMRLLHPWVRKGRIPAMHTVHGTGILSGVCYSVIKEQLPVFNERGLLDAFIYYRRRHMPKSCIFEKSFLK